MANNYPIIQPVSQLYRPAATLRVRPRTSGEYIQECNRVYAEAHGIGLMMDIFSPITPKNGLGIVDVISSAWHSDRFQLNEHLGLGAIDILCKRGYTVFAVGPGSVTKFMGLDMIRHVRAAIRYVKAKAHEFSIDPDRLGLFGASAGGHLAILAALNPIPAHQNSRDEYRRQDTTVQAVATLFPPTDLVDFGGKQFPNMALEGLRLDSLLFENGIKGHSPEEIEARLLDLSPARLVKNTNLPPFMLLHGTADPIVPLEQSEKMRDALQQKGVPVDFIVREGGAHPWPDAYVELEQMADWFDTILAQKPKQYL